MAASNGETAAAPTYPIQPVGSPRALVVHCGDPRFQAPIARFLGEELGLHAGDYLPLVVGGGVASLAVGDWLPKEAKFVRESIAFYVNLFASVERLVLINHEDCGKYRALARALPHFVGAGEGAMGARHRLDLEQAAAVLGARHGKAVEGYYAAFANADRTLVRFEKQAAR